MQPAQPLVERMVQPCDCDVEVDTFNYAPIAVLFVVGFLAAT